MPAAAGALGKTIRPAFSDRTPASRHEKSTVTRIVQRCHGLSRAVSEKDAGNAEPPHPRTPGGGVPDRPVLLGGRQRLSDTDRASRCLAGPAVRPADMGSA